MFQHPPGMNVSHKIIHLPFPQKTPFQPLLFSHVSLCGFPTSSSRSFTTFTVTAHKKKHTLPQSLPTAMMKEDTSGHGSGHGGGILSWGRACDTCGTAACAVYCLADSAYLCSACDARIHAANRLASRHERARVCESCERAPAAFLCKADAASLCAACDDEVHSANPLARRHHRVPILFPSSPGPVDPPLFSADETVDEEEEEDEEAASWLLMDQGNAGNFLDLVEYSDSTAEDRYVDVKSYGGNGVVPLKNGDGGEGYDQVQQQLFLGLEFKQVSKSVHGHSHTTSLRHSVRILVTLIY